MRYEEACRVADVLPVRNPCMQIIMLGRATDMLRDLGLPIPAWTIPASSWLVVAHHAGEDGDTAIGLTGSDAAVLAALRAAGHYVSTRNGRRTKMKGSTLYTWHCPLHAEPPASAPDAG